MLTLFCRQRDLFNILKAYAIYDPATGYCQVRMKVIKVISFVKDRLISSLETNFLTVT